MTTDLKANHYILFNSYDYQKPQLSSYIIRQLFGDGAFSSHKLWVYQYYGLMDTS